MPPVHVLAVALWADLQCEVIQQIQRGATRSDTITAVARTCTVNSSPLSKLHAADTLYAAAS